jgi:inorganic phosphate transporter, PiT family
VQIRNLEDATIDLSFSIFLLLFSGAYVGWNIGANDTANCIGTTVGCGLLNFRRGVVLVGVFAFAGSVIGGHKVMHTLGTGIIKADVSPSALIIALICSGIFVTVATFRRLPVSTAQTIVGGVVGIGLAVRAEIDYSWFLTIAGSWLICPLLSLVLAFALVHVISFVTSRLKVNPIMIKNSLGWLAIFSSCYVAYGLGANNVGVAVGPIANLGLFSSGFLLTLGGLSIALGAATYGKQVAYTVGKDITPLGIPEALAAQLSSAFGLHLFAMFGIPVSSSAAIVGAVIGAGLINGFQSISKKIIITILLGWVLTPCCAAGASFFLYRLFISLTASGA